MIFIKKKYSTRDRISIQQTHQRAVWVSTQPNMKAYMPLVMLSLFATAVAMLGTRGTFAAEQAIALRQEQAAALRQEQAAALRQEQAEAAVWRREREAQLRQEQEAAFRQEQEALQEAAAQRAILETLPERSVADPWPELRTLPEALVPEQEAALHQELETLPELRTLPEALVPEESTEPTPFTSDSNAQAVPKGIVDSQLVDSLAFTSDSGMQAIPEGIADSQHENPVGSATSACSQPHRRRLRGHRALFGWLTGLCSSQGQVENRRRVELQQPPQTQAQRAISQELPLHDRNAQTLMVLGKAVKADIGVTAKRAILQFGSGPWLELPAQDPFYSQSEHRQLVTKLAEGIYPHFASK